MSLKIDMLAINNCMICNSGDLKHIGNKKTMNKHSDINFSICQCQSCGHWLTNPMPQQEFLNGLYSENSAHLLTEGWAEKTKNENNKGLKRNSSNWVVDFLSEYPAGNFLEIGSGNGALIRKLREMGWNSYGIDLGNYAKDLNVFNSQSNLPKNLPFDCIVFQDVLEHVSDPMEVISSYASYLAPNALLFMAVPWSESKGARTQKTDWIMVQPMAHLHYFSKNSATRMLEACGFEIIKCTTINIYFRNYFKSLLLNSIHFISRLLRPWKWKVAHEKIDNLIMLIKLFPGDQEGDQLHLVARLKEH